MKYIVLFFTCLCLFYVNRFIEYNPNAINFLLDDRPKYIENISFASGCIVIDIRPTKPKILKDRGIYECLNLFLIYPDSQDVFSRNTFTYKFIFYNKVIMFAET